VLTIGSRGSKLALWQANHINSVLEGQGHECVIEVIKTSGDLRTDVPLKEVGNKGVFTKEIEEALLAGTIDLAVHSLKDMPTVLPDGLNITATPEREDVRDVLLGKTLLELNADERVGTGSLRRVAQLKALRPDLRIEAIRGNVDTRIRKLQEGQYEAIVLAAAGLRRLGLHEHIREYLSVEQMCPAVGQGSLAIETRMDGGPGYQAVVKLDNPETRAAVTAERAVLARLGGGCEVPIGAYGKVSDGKLHVRGIVISPDGTRRAKGEVEGAAADAEALGFELADRLQAGGAREILASV